MAETVELDPSELPPGVAAVSRDGLADDARYQGGTNRGLGARICELAILLIASVGAVALGLGISDYLGEHPYVLGYLLAYAGYRLADAMLIEGIQSGRDAQTRGPRWLEELPILVLFGAAPFERTYIYGGEPPRGVAALGLLLELAGLWLAIGARIQLRLARDGRLLRRGFYRYVRHPVRCGASLVLLAWPFEYCAPMVAILTLVILIKGQARAIGREESEMIARFGDDYQSYVRDTDRMIPNLW